MREEYNDIRKEKGENQRRGSKKEREKQLRRIKKEEQAMRERKKHTHMHLEYLCMHTPHMFYKRG